MEKDRILDALKEQDNAVLIELLETAYNEMNTNQRRAVFGTFAQKMPPPMIDGEELLGDIEVFHKESLAGVYYAPFNVNSKNYMDIPEETDEWFERLGDYLERSRQLSQQGNHRLAIQCFGVLHKLIDSMEDGEEIVFADELGSWMIPIDEKPCLHACIMSLSAISTPEDFTKAAIPMLRRDGYDSLTHKVYPTIKKFANKAQREALDLEIARQNIRIT